MSNKMITAAWNVPLPAHARLVLIALADSASDDNGTCWISNRTLMEKSTAAKTTLFYILGAFERLGIVARETRFRPENGSQTSSLKRVKIPVFSGTKKEIEAAKAKFIIEFEAAYSATRSRKNTISQHVTAGEGSLCDLPHPTLGDTPLITQSDSLYESPIESSSELEEEEDVPCEIHEVFPAPLSLVSEDELAAAIDYVVGRFAKRSPAGYRAKLMAGLLQSDAGWVVTVEEGLLAVRARADMPSSKAHRRVVGEVVGEIQARINLMQIHGAGDKEISHEVSVILRNAALSGRISPSDSSKIMHDLKYVVGGAA